ncbi:MAG: hypothetical protein PHQ12_11015 [Chthoniobacteraceae bacterium]|nr:hypothetical protein [Chthoniobacteraceae bacterium]
MSPRSPISPHSGESAPDLARLSALLNEVAGLECQAIVLERRILADRIRIAEWYNANPITAIAAWENEPRISAPVHQTPVVGE